MTNICVDINMREAQVALLKASAAQAEELGYSLGEAIGDLLGQLGFSVDNWMFEQGYQDSRIIMTDIAKEHYRSLNAQVKRIES